MVKKIKRNLVLVDFDGTIAEQITLVDELPTKIIGNPIFGVRRKLWELKDKGYKILIFSGRIDSAYPSLAKSQKLIIKQYCQYHDIPCDGFYAKPNKVALIIDDIARRPDEDFSL